MTAEPIDLALRAALGRPKSDELTDRANRFSNQPNAAKGGAKMESDPDAEKALLSVFDEQPDVAADALRDSVAMWALLALAARADVTLLDRLPADITEHSAPKIASIRRATKKHAAALAAQDAESS